MFKWYGVIFPQISLDLKLPKLTIIALLDIIAYLTIIGILLKNIFIFYHLKYCWPEPNSLHIATYFQKEILRKINLWKWGPKIVKKWVEMWFFLHFFKNIAWHLSFWHYSPVWKSQKYSSISLKRLEIQGICLADWGLRPTFFIVNNQKKNEKNTVYSNNNLQIIVGQGL